VVLVPDLVGRLDGLETLLALAVDAGVDEDFLGHVQDEAIALVHGRDADWNLQKQKYSPQRFILISWLLYLANAHVATTLDLEETLFHLVLVDVLETRSNTARHITHT